MNIISRIPISGGGPVYGLSVMVNKVACRLKRETALSTLFDAKTTCGIRGHQSPGLERVGTDIENEGNRSTH